ncbi:unnamed protein product, partial [Staurois parvus]
MRRCSGSPCRAYLVLHSRDVSPAASPAISLRRMPASGFCVPVPVTSGHMGAAGGGTFENLKKNSFFSKLILRMLCPVPCLHFYCSF